MQSIHDHEFAQFLMRIGDGNEPAKEDDMVKMPAEIVIPWEGESSIKKLIQHTFPQLENHGWNASYMVERAILTPKNCDVHMLNDMISNKFPGDEHILLSFDEVEGHNAGKRAFLPIIKLKTTDGAGLPFVLIRKHFPVKLSFAIIINKSQGQTIPNVGIYIPRHVFSHGQLYVALSRGVSRAATRVLIKDGKVEGEEGDFTKNIVFKEILLSQPQATMSLNISVNVYVYLLNKQ
ncbi:uncharacterized protein LOC127102768 [Lathyrus oleraceus]|uniref:uncharacterized protein LOC127102768 n=1 Tax=Pisum sativum TaxID=3888 RepID=UPI0021CE79B2|nr:uncharacterized protein LOC127102768 [Pisum sativum]